MSLTVPSVTFASFSATVQPSILSPLGNSIPIIEPLTFANVANLMPYTGTFTPANNTHTIVTGLSAISPNFFMFFCDGLAVLDTDNSFFSGVPVNKFMMGTFTTIVGGANPISQFYLNGMTAQSYPMAQGTPLNYTLIIGQATIT